jgi:hypothetical protein
MSAPCTHVLVDSNGVPLLRGTAADMVEQILHCTMLGIVGCKVEPIAMWDWTLVNWGD